MSAPGNADQNTTIVPQAARDLIAKFQRASRDRAFREVANRVLAHAALADNRPRDPFRELVASHQPDSRLEPSEPPKRFRSRHSLLREALRTGKLSTGSDDAVLRDLNDAAHGDRDARARVDVFLDSTEVLNVLEEVRRD